MAHLGIDRMQSGPFSLQFLEQELPPFLQLFPENAGPRLPGQRQPGEKSGTVALRRPRLSFERIGQRFPPLVRCFERVAFRARRRLIGLQPPQQSRARQLLERVVHLRLGNGCPIANLPPFEFRVRLIPVHRPLRQQAQQHQVRGRQRHRSLCANIPACGLSLGCASCARCVHFQ